MDCICAKCGEPWDWHGIPRRFDDTDGDMKFSEAKRFRAGEGCPSCGFGTYCPLCGGSGKESDYSRNQCCSNGRVLAWSPRNDSGRFRAGEFYTGYEPAVQHVHDPNIVRKIDSYRSRDGYVDNYWIVCPTCNNEGEHLFPCSRCDGSGKLETDEDLKLEAARVECSATDEDPMLVLQRRGLI